MGSASRSIVYLGWLGVFVSTGWNTAGEKTVSDSEARTWLFLSLLYFAIVHLCGENSFNPSLPPLCVRILLYWILPEFTEYDPNRTEAD